MTDDHDWRGRLRAAWTQPLVVQILGGVAATLITTAAIGKFWLSGYVALLLGGATILITGLAMLFPLYSRSDRAWVFAVAIVLVITGAAGSGALAGSRLSAHPQPTSITRPVKSRTGLDVSEFGLQPGDCLKAPQVRTPKPMPDSFSITSCSTDHDAEVYFSGDMWDLNIPFPGEKQIAARVEGRCSTEFEKYVGLSLEKSVFNYQEVAPSAESWDTKDRRLVCMAFHPHRPVSYSVRALNG